MSDLNFLQQVKVLNFCWQPGSNQMTETEKGHHSIGILPNSDMAIA
jgi:hypothetical protein